jgi:hypothetical protein
MGAGTTEQALASIGDEGLFERLATAILRNASPLYESLAHTGVNAAGKTIKSPLDGICFVYGSDPRHLIAVHHTTTARDGLEGKWLHDRARRLLEARRFERSVANRSPAVGGAHRQSPLGIFYRGLLEQRR